MEPGSARLADGGVMGGTANYLQIFKEDICRYLEKISADMPGNLQVYAGKVSAKVSAGKVPCRKKISAK